MSLPHSPPSRTFGLILFAVLALPLLIAAALTSDAAPSLQHGSKTGNGNGEEEGRAGEANEAEVETLVRSMNAFGGQFYRALTTGEDAADGNLFVSPYSVHRALGLVYPGARGQTAEEIREVLRIELTTERYLAAAALLEERLTERVVRQRHMPREWVPSRLNVANAGWYEQTIPFRQDYLDQLGAHFELPVRPADFLTQSDAERERINEWVAEQTNNLIDELIPANTINPMTVFVLTNAVYFIAKWETTFRVQRTRERTFTTLDGDEVEVPMMHGDVPGRYAQTDDYVAFELPYRLSNQAMTILFPQEDKLADLERQLAEGAVFETIGEMRSGRIRLAMPRFSMSTEANLNDLLKGMGMPTAFTDRADLTGMTTEEVLISDVLHQGTLDVNEEGTEASAATAVFGERLGEPPQPNIEVTLDRPFLLLIRDTRTNAIIFLGRVANPSSE